MIDPLEAPFGLTEDFRKKNKKDRLETTPERKAVQKGELDKSRARILDVIERVSPEF